MVAIGVFMFVTLVLCAAVAGVVVIGMQGRGRDRAPRIASTMTKAARHLNGEARRPPRAVQRLIDVIPTHR